MNPVLLLGALHTCPYPPFCLPLTLELTPRTRWPIGLIDHEEVFAKLVHIRHESWWSGNGTKRQREMTGSQNRKVTLFLSLAKFLLTLLTYCSYLRNRNERGSYFGTWTSLSSPLCLPHSSNLLHQSVLSSSLLGPLHCFYFCSQYVFHLFSVYFWICVCTAPILTYSNPVLPPGSLLFARRKAWFMKTTKRSLTPSYFLPCWGLATCSE